MDRSPRASQAVHHRRSSSIASRKLPLLRTFPTRQLEISVSSFQLSTTVGAEDGSTRWTRADK